MTELELIELIKRHGPRVRRWIAPRVPRKWRSMLSVDDIMQQAYTEAFLSLGRVAYRDERSFAAWLRKVAECKWKDAVRMLTAEKRGADRRRRSGASEDAERALFDTLAAAGTTPSQHVARTEWQAALTGALQRLPEDYRRVVVLYDLEKQPVDEVARALGRSPGAVYNMRARAHRLLSALLGDASAHISSA